MKRKYELKGGIYQYLCYSLMEASRLICDAVLEETNENANDPNLFMKNVIANLKNWEGFVKKITKPRYIGAYAFEGYDLEAFAFLTKTAYENIQEETEETLRPFAEMDKIDSTSFLKNFLEKARIIFLEYAHVVKELIPEDVTFWNDKVEEINKKLEYMSKYTSLD